MGGQFVARCLSGDPDCQLDSEKTDVAVGPDQRTLKLNESGFESIEPT
jgi:hypothetical protein